MNAPKEPAIPDTNFTRLSVNLSDKTAANLRRIAAQQNITYTEAIAKMVDAYRFIVDEELAGRVIQTVQPDGEIITQIRLLP